MKYKIFLYTLIFLLIFTLPFKFGFFGSQREYVFPKIVPIGIGAIELISAILISYKPTRRFGAKIAFTIFSIAILAHVFVLGIWYGKIMFPLALVGLILSVYIHRKNFNNMLE